MQPVSFSNDALTSTGSDAPPEMQDLIEDRSYFGVSGELLIAV